MKFDILGALDKAQQEFPEHTCSINCTKSDGSYLIQIKVLVSPNLAYGQQIAVSVVEAELSSWWEMNERFNDALHSLHVQIAGD